MGKKSKFALFCITYFILLVILFCIFHNQIVKLVVFCELYILPIAILNKTGVINQPVNQLRGRFYAIQLQGSPKGLSVGEKFKFRNIMDISVGNNCSIGCQVRIMPLGQFGDIAYPSKITIGNNVHIGDFTTIASMESVVIEDNVLFASYVHITDHSHEYRDITKPVINQGVFSSGGGRDDKAGRMAWI